MKLLITGGRQRLDSSEVDLPFRYLSGLVVEVDLTTGETETVYEYTGRELDDGSTAVEATPCLKSATPDGDLILIAANTEILAWSRDERRVIWSVTSPLFNDLHHVAPTPDGTLLVVSTGVDGVIEIDRSGTVRRVWDTLFRESGPVHRTDVDYRAIPSTKPHDSHPNYVFTVDGETFVTRFKQRDAVSLDDPTRRFSVDLEGCHDGVVSDATVSFTTVDGFVRTFDALTREVVTTTRLLTGAADRASHRPLGWCRGLAHLRDGRVVVGFSRIRQTATKANIAWAKRVLKGGSGGPPVPTHLSIYDLANGDGVELERFQLEPVGMHSVFSIIAID